MRYLTGKKPALIDAITTNGSAAGARHRSESGKPYQRKSASSGTENGTTSEKESKVDSTKVYTKEQLEGVQRIKRCKDYYEILGTSKDASDEDLKKAYRKLALKFHPDKNHAPGATEAFKAIGNAYALLSNPAKRKDYDQYGDSQSPGNYQHGGFEFHRNYESDITPEDLFNMFFGGGFPSGNTQPYSNGRARASHQSSHRGEREEERADGGFSTFIQLMPIIVLVLVSVLSQLMVTTPPYSLYYRAAMEHTVRKQTSNLKVVYYVNKDFDKEYTGVTLQKVEKSVEEDYINNLRNNCWRERQEKNDYLYASKVYRDDRLRKKAELMRMESCEKLARLNDLYRGG
ncbi:dnaJ homolog subfamily B member 14 isoform X2 [Scyliorhinus canicula]|uniref:dnaJ homolog subfamily B member 14 isoform X2 n=1 Tax=Scyliorhinus canicula TaxID=7830 RepID=UPI0018F5FA03|nr:dnaJ homolog subfamily B member 14 isoform X2 [Scyliorhinus canicula]